MESSVADRSKLNYRYNEKHPGSFVSVEKKENWISLVSDNDTTLRLHFLTEEIIRFRYSVKGYFLNDFSYAIDPAFKSDKPQYKVKELKRKIVVSTSRLQIEIEKSQLLVNIYDHEGQLLSADEKGFHWEDDLHHGGEIVKMSKFAQKSEAFYGLGDKTSDQNIRGKRFVNWGTDEFGYKGDTDPLYKNINLIYSFHRNKASAIFFDNSFRTHFDLACERKEIMSYWADGGEMNYYFIGGEDLKGVAENYALLTGRPEMPALWALGYQQSKWSYYPESRVREICNTMRKERIPCDAIYLDIDYMDGFRCFTWNNTHFPEPKRMVAELKEEGFKTVAIIDPGIKIDPEYEIFQQGLEGDYFCKRTDGPYVQGKVWPGECYFPDFTNPEVRSWWAGLFEELISDIGLAGIWNDMNEPAIFEVPTKTFPLDVRHDYDGNPCSHRKAHNIYGMQMTQATADGVKKFAGNKRPLIITRSGYAGMQRFTSTWTGDNLATWEHLYLAHLQALRLSISGVSYCGSDIGGFIDQPDGELFVRWMQLAIFHPFFRTHSSGDHGDQEPWSFGKKYLNLTRSVIELRYKLLPYLYTCFYQYHKNGTPMLRPIVFEEQSNEKQIVNNNQEGFLGDHVLYSPVFEKGAKYKELSFPEGQWYDYFNNKLIEGNTTQKVKAGLDKIPMFVRAGAIIPQFPVMQYVGEQEIETVYLRAYHKRGSVKSEFYIDDFDGHQYKEGAFRHSKFIQESGSDFMNISQTYVDSYNPKFQYFLVQIIGLSANELSIEVDGEYLQYYRVLDDNIIEIAASKNFRSININF